MNRLLFPGWRRGGLDMAAFLLAMGVGILPAGLSRATAADVEVRDFNILVDNKRAGEYHVTMQSQDDGTLSMAVQSSVRVTVLAVPVYTYTYRGQEVWKNGLLLHFESSGKENSKDFAVSADAVGNGLRVKANGQEHMTRPDVWTTSGLILPDAKFRNQAVPLLGCDNGKDLNGQLQYIGNEPVQIAGQNLRCTHYRVIREVPHDMWYDGRGRLVRQEWLADGHRSVLELVGVRQ
jgi:uncharacterized protein DUF6134